MKFKVDRKQIKTREMIEAQNSDEATVNMMSRFMVDANDQPVPEDEAREKLLEMSLDDLLDAQEIFRNAMLPKANGRR